MTNNPICFVCGVSGASCFLSTKPQGKGAYFTFLNSHYPPNGAKMPDSDGFVSACIVCKAFLTEQWSSYERHKTPLVERIFWMKRIDDQAFTGAEMHVQGEYVAQFIGINNNGLPSVIDELPDHSSRDRVKLKRTTDASSPGMHNDTEDTSSSYDDGSGVLDLSTSPKKSTFKLSNKNNQNSSKSFPVKTRSNYAQEKKSRARQNPIQHSSTFVCYICTGKFYSPQKSRFLSCTYTSDDEPYFPFVKTLDRPEGAKEITKSGLAEVCCDCRKSLSRQWRVFEARKIPLDRRNYDVESLAGVPHSSDKLVNTNNNTNNVTHNNKPDASILDRRNCNEKLDNGQSKCFFCLQSATTFQSISNSFLKGKLEHVINVLPLSKKMLEFKSSNSNRSEILSCGKCLQVLLLEKRVLDKSASVPSSPTGVDKNPTTTNDHSHANGPVQPSSAREELFECTDERVSFSGLAPENDLSRPAFEPSKEHPSDQSRSNATASAFSSVCFCFLCRSELNKTELQFANQKAALIQYFVNLMSYTVGPCKISNEVMFCGNCSNYLVSSLLKGIRSLTMKKESLNGDYDLSKYSICFCCSSKVESNKTKFLPLKAENLKGDTEYKKFENLLRLGVKEIVTCKQCFGTRCEASSLKRKLLDVTEEREAKVTKSDLCEVPRQSKKINEDQIDKLNAPADEKDEHTKNLRGVGFKLEHASAAGHKNSRKSDENVERERHKTNLLMLNTSVHAECVRAPADACDETRHASPADRGSSSSSPRCSVVTTMPSALLPPPQSSQGSSFLHNLNPHLSSAHQLKVPHAAKPFPHFLSGYFDPSLYLAQYHAVVNHLVTDQEWTIEKQASHIKMLSAHLFGTRHSVQRESLPSASPSSLCHESSAATNKPTLYRPFLDEESPKLNFCDRANPKVALRRECFSEGKFSASNSTYLHNKKSYDLEPRCSSASNLMEVSSTIYADDVKDERLTAALGLISLCCSEISNVNLENNNSNRADTKENKTDRNFPPATSDGRDSTNNDRPPARNNIVVGNSITAETINDDVKSSIRWPGIAAITESYNKHFSDQLSEKKCLQSDQNILLMKKQELVHGSRELEDVLKHLHQEKKSLGEEGRRVLDEIIKLKSCLTV